MEKTSTFTQRAVKASGSEKRRDQFLAVFLRHLKTCHIHTDESMLVIGGSWQDIELLKGAGFKDITLSNLQPDLVEGEHRDSGFQVKQLAIDAEQVDLRDGSFDCVFAHEVLHHCRSPHRGLCEMLRVARKHVVLLEPNDSLFMRALIRTGFSFAYEIFSVVHHGYKAGGVRDSCVPNFVYRWNADEVRKTVSSYLAEYRFTVHSYSHWDFNVNAEHLSKRKETKIHWITSLIGAEVFLASLRILQTVFNLIPVLRGQGNKFFCCIEKSTDLQPWLAAESDGRIAFHPGS